MNRCERRKRAIQHAKSRRQKIVDKYGHPIFNAKYPGIVDQVPIGYFRNNNEANKYANAGKPTKTNRRKAHAVYRDKLGGYGKPMNWSASDQRKLDSIYYDEE